MQAVTTTLNNTKYYSFANYFNLLCRFVGWFNQQFNEILSGTLYQGDIEIDLQFPSFDIQTIGRRDALAIKAKNVWQTGNLCFAIV